MDQIIPKRKRKWIAELQLDKLISIRLINKIVKEKIVTISFYDNGLIEDDLKVLYDWISDVYKLCEQPNVKALRKEDYKLLNLVCQPEDPQLQFDFKKNSFMVFPKSINWGELDFSSSDMLTIEIEFFILEE